jgi:hypothetical protein
MQKDVKEAQQKRAQQLREQVEELKRKGGPDKKDENYREFINRRMRELDKEKGSKI